jgi:hypothetical protein
MSSEYNDVLRKELDQNKVDKEVLEREANILKGRFAEDISAMSYRNLAIKPVSHKKPFKVRFMEWKAEFMLKIMILLGFYSHED